MPELQTREKPAAITHAISAIERYEQQLSAKHSDGGLGVIAAAYDVDASDAYIQWLKKTLPALAMSITQKEGDIDTDVLLHHAEKGQAHIEALLAEMKTQRVKPKRAVLTYDAVVLAFPKNDIRPEFFGDCTELGTAAVKNDLTQLQELINAGVDIHASDGVALRWATQSGHYDAVKLLIDNGADIDAHDGCALRMAALYGHYNVVKLLIENGANIRENYDGALHDGALSKAASNGHYNVAKLLIENSANIHAENSATLRSAARNGHADMVKLLLDNGADIHVKKSFALACAADNGHSDIIKLLIDNGAGIHTNINNALHLAVQKGHYNVVKLLIDNKADIHAGRDCAVLKASEKGYYNVVKLLIQSGADIHSSDDYAVQGAARGGHIDVVRLLIENGANIHAGNDRSLLSALEYQHYDVVGLFVQEDPLLEEKHLKADKKYTSYKTWKRLHNEFNAPGVLLDKNPYDFKLKTYLAVEAMLNKEGYDGRVCADYAYNISTLFRNEDRVLRYLQKWGEAGKQPLHDCAQFINIPDAGGIDYKSWGDAVLQQGPKMARLVKFADRLASPEKTACGKNWSLTATKAQVAQFVYKDAIKHPHLAAACFDFNWDVAEFKDAVKQVKKYKKLFAENGLKKTQSRLPAIKIDGAAFSKPDYHFYKLPDGDMRGLLLGEFTNCCQHLANQGADCAKHGFLSEEGGFYVVAHKKTDEIIGQSWAWRGKKEELVFDSLESLSGHFNAQNWGNIADAFAKNIEQDNASQISALHIGKGGATPDLNFNKAAVLAGPIDYKGYRDSKNKQYIVAEFKP